MSAWYKAEKWNFLFREAQGGYEIEQIQLFSNYSHVEQHHRQAKKNQVVRWDYFLHRYEQLEH